MVWRGISGAYHCPSVARRLSRPGVVRLAASAAILAAYLASGLSAQAQSGVLQTVVAYADGNSLERSSGVTLDARGNIYGTVAEGGDSGEGAVFEIVAGSGRVTTLASFHGPNGSYPVGGLVRDANGNLYGATQGGGENGDGTVFMVGAGTGRLTTLASFDGEDGKYPDSGLTMDGRGNLYGTTQSGGASGHGTVFELRAGASTITALASFDSAKGSSPYGHVTLDSRGSLYGTTYGGAAANGGSTVFQLTPNAAVRAVALEPMKPVGIALLLSVAALPIGFAAWRRWPGSRSAEQKKT